MFCFGTFCMRYEIRQKKIQKVVVKAEDIKKFKIFEKHRQKKGKTAYLQMKTHHCCEKKHQEKTQMKKNSEY